MIVRILFCSQHSLKDHIDKLILERRKPGLDAPRSRHEIENHILGHILAQNVKEHVVMGLGHMLEVGQWPAGIELAALGVVLPERVVAVQIGAADDGQ